MAALLNSDPRLRSSSACPDSPPPLPSASQDALRDELFSLVRRITDPEHPHTLEELGVVDKRHIWFRGGHGRTQAGDGWQSGAEQQQQLDEGGKCEDGAADVDVEEEEEEDLAVIELTPTVPHCSLASTIGLCVRYRVESAIPNIKLEVRIRDGTHRTAAESRTHQTYHRHQPHSPPSTSSGATWLISTRNMPWLLCPVSKQLNDKERCCAAMENPAIADIVLSLTRERVE